MLYAAYGSNMNIRQMKLRCPDASVICTGKLIGWKLVFNVHADIICTGNNNDIVPVVLWDISDKDLRNLDKYEGFPNYYVKADITVELDEKRKNKKDNARVLAIAYVMNKKRKGVCQPATHYFYTIEQGYVDNGLDIKHLYDALEYSIENETEHNQYNPKKRTN